MREMRCFEAISAGLILDGDVAVLSFLTNNTVNDTEASVVMTRELLQLLHHNMEKMLETANAGPASRLGRPAKQQDENVPEICEV